MATIATAGLSSLSQITYPAHSYGGPTAVLPGGFVCLPTLPKYPRSITRPLLIDYPNHTVCRSDWLDTGWPVTKSLRTHPNDADVDPNSSDGVDPSSSEGVDPSSSKGVDTMSSEGVDTMSPEGVDTMSSEGVDTMLTQTPAKLLSVLVPNVSCRRIVRLPLSRIPVELITVAIAAIAAITAIAAIAAIEAIAAL